jgi:NAD(P)-dependent dehydrogenase (short-subunit alcohol dehydrogenase family)
VAEAVVALRAHRVRAIGSAVDVADAAAYAVWIAAAAADLGGLDIFVHNVSALAEGDDEDTWRRTYEVDLLGGVRGFRVALPYLRRSAAGAVVLIASISAAMSESSPETHAYGALKAALVSLGGQLGRTYGAAAGVRVNVVSPGSIDFPGGYWDSVKQTDSTTYEAVRATIPFGRMGTPEEVGRAVAFLASPVASWINGVNLRVDGGQLSHVNF